MHYYPFHCGDYALSTRHLNIFEDLAYRRLLDLYYTSEKTIPEPAKAARLIMMSDHIESVTVVLEEFFKATEDGYINMRADIEILKYQGFKAQGAIGAAKRWAKGGDTPPIAPVIPTKNQEPRTINQEPLTKGNSKDLSQPVASTGKKGTRLSAEWFLPKEWGEWAIKENSMLSVDDIRRIADDFRDHWISKPGKDALKLDWLATWRKWVRSPLNERKTVKAADTAADCSAQAERVRIKLFGGINAN